MNKIRWFSLLLAVFFFGLFAAEKFSDFHLADIEWENWEQWFHEEVTSGSTSPLPKIEEVSLGHSDDGGNSEDDLSESELDAEENTTSTTGALVTRVYAMDCSQSANVELNCSGETECETSYEDLSGDDDCDFVLTVGNGTDTIEVRGDELCVQYTSNAISTLQSDASPRFDYVLAQIGKVECSDEGTGNYVWEESPRVVVDSDTSTSGKGWYAGSLIYGACLDKQYRDYADSHPDTTVPVDVYKGEEANQLCGREQYDTLEELGASSEVLDYIRDWYGF